MYRAVTRNIEVLVTPRFVADRSSPENNYFFWAYTIAITNNGTDTVQLKTRHWRITDASGRRQEVRGAGVVGEEPVLKAGESFEYTSGVPLQTPSGFMVGTYGMVSASGEHFDIEIPAFSLDSAATASGRSIKPAVHRHSFCEMPAKKPRRAPYCGAKTPMPVPSRSS